MASCDETDQQPLLRDEEQEQAAFIKWKIPFPSCRLVLCVMAFLGNINLYALRVNLSVALVAMVNSSYDEVKNNSDDCPGLAPLNETKHYQTSGEFNWDSNLQGLVLGAFFYGYILTQVPGGFLAERLGGKWLYGCGVLMTAVLTILTPLAARCSVYLFIAVRVLEGIGEGMTFPALHALISQWAPPLERSKIGTFIYSGAMFGTVVSLPISGLLCAYGPFGGWPSVFYIFGACGCVWFIFWGLLIHNRPSEHPRISVSEREYIEKSINHNEKKPALPIRAIATSVPFWALLVAHASFNWAFYTMLTCMPTYMKEVLKFDMSENGFLSAIPYLAQGIIMIISGQVVDFLRYNHYLSTTAARKIANTIGLGMPAVGLVITGYVGCNKVLAVVMLSIAVGFGGTSMSGYGVNHLDLAPPFAGTLMGLTNTAATIPGFVGPQIVGLLTNNNPTRERWQVVFWISAGVCLVGLTSFALFSSGKEQPWVSPEYLEAQEAKRQMKRHKSITQTQVPEKVLQFSRPGTHVNVVNQNSSQSE